MCGNKPKDDRPEWMITESRLIHDSIELDSDQISEVLIAIGVNRTRIQGNNVQADHCPLHQNNSPTLGVSIDPPHPWSCFHPDCKKGPNIVTLVAAGFSIRDDQAEMWLRKRFPEVFSYSGKKLAPIGANSEKRVLPPFTLTEAVLSAYPLVFDGDDKGERAIKYLGLCTVEQAYELGLGYDWRRDNLVFPVRHQDGKLGGLVGRCMRQNPSNRYFNYDEPDFKTGRVLLGNHLPVDKDHPIVVVEGPTDFLNMWAMGVPNVRSLLGAKFTDEQVEMLVGHRLPIVPLFDEDKAGYAAKKKFRKAVRKRVPLYNYEYPEYADDPGKIKHEDKDELMASFTKPQLRSLRRRK